MDDTHQTVPSAEEVAAVAAELERRYPFVGSRVLGQSFLHQELRILQIGNGDLPILYIAAHHGMESITARLLLRFAGDLCEAIDGDRVICGVHPAYLRQHRSIYLLPLLNPDGVMIAGGRLSAAHPLYERLRKMNRGSADFSAWQANGRGVDLNHNYNAGFADYAAIAAAQGIFGGAATRFPGEYPESEPESAALCALVRELRPALSLTLHTQGEEIYASSCGRIHPGSAAIATLAAKLTGYHFAMPEGGAAYGGYTDWVIDELGLPSLTVECGKGTNPLPQTALPAIYGRLRPLLFRAPTFVGG